MTEDTTYNGWTNYETWNVKLWIDNEEGDYHYWRERVQEIRCNHTEVILKDVNNIEDDIANFDSDSARYDLMTELQDWVEEGNPLNEQPSMYSDLLGAAICEVNWHEIAQAMIDDQEDT